jgi:hypothetical protein
VSIDEVLREMRESIFDCDPDDIERWTDAIEAAMTHPVAYYWMSSKWHCHEVHMADDLPCNAPHDKQALHAFPPDAAAEIERLREALEMIATSDVGWDSGEWEPRCDDGRTPAEVAKAVLVGKQP